MAIGLKDSMNVRGGRMFQGRAEQVRAVRTVVNLDRRAKRLVYRLVGIAESGDREIIADPAG